MIKTLKTILVEKLHITDLPPQEQDTVITEISDIVMMDLMSAVKERLTHQEFALLQNAFENTDAELAGKIIERAIPDMQGLLSRTVHSVINEYLELTGEASSDNSVVTLQVRDIIQSDLKKIFTNETVNKNWGQYKNESVSTFMKNNLEQTLKLRLWIEEIEKQTDEKILENDTLESYATRAIIHFLKKQNS